MKYGFMASWRVLNVLYQFIAQLPICTNGLFSINCQNFTHPTNTILSYNYKNCHNTKFSLVATVSVTFNPGGCCHLRPVVAYESDSKLALKSFMLGSGCHIFHTFLRIDPLALIITDNKNIVAISFFRKDT